MSDLERPRRRFTVHINVSGDEWSDVTRALEELAGHVGDHGPSCSSVSGGCSGGHYVTVIEDPNMTHERYVGALEAYLAARKAVSP